MYKVVIELKEVDEKPNFPEAFVVFYNEILKLLQKGTTQMVFEAACWIEVTYRSHPSSIMNFYEARNRAYAIELLKDGELQPITSDMK